MAAHASALTVARAAIEDGHARRRGATVASCCAAHAQPTSDHTRKKHLSTTKVRDRARERVAQEREARWGELMCTAALERPRHMRYSMELERSVDRVRRRDQVRLADKQLSVGFRFGFVRHLSDSRAVWELLDQVDDPFVRCSFLSMHAWALVLGAYYDEALDAARGLLADATDFRVRPALPYGHATEASPLAWAGDEERAHVNRARRSVRLVASTTSTESRTRTRSACGSCSRLVLSRKRALPNPRMSRTRFRACAARSRAHARLLSRLSVG